MTFEQTKGLNWKFGNRFEDWNWRQRRGFIGRTKWVLIYVFDVSCMYVCYMYDVDYVCDDGCWMYDGRRRVDSI